MMTMTIDELYHHGILGQKWGVRRYQNPDGSLTSEGKARYRESLMNYEATKKIGKLNKFTSGVNKSVDAESLKEAQKLRNKLYDYSDEVNRYANQEACKTTGVSDFWDAIEQDKYREYLQAGLDAAEKYHKDHDAGIKDIVDDYEKRRTELAASAHKYVDEILEEYADQASPRVTALTYHTDTGEMTQATYREVGYAYADMILGLEKIALNEDK